MIPASISAGISPASAAALRESETVTFAPRSRRNRAAEIPDLPAPTTSTRLFFSSIASRFYPVPRIYRSFNVVSANSANTSAIIQNRAITLLSLHPISSK